MAKFLSLENLAEGEKIYITPSTKVMHGYVPLQTNEKIIGEVVQVIKHKKSTRVRVRLPANDKSDSIIVELNSLYLLSVEIVEDVKTFWQQLSALWKKVFPGKKQ